MIIIYCSVAGHLIPWLLILSNSWSGIGRWL